MKAGKGRHESEGWGQGGRTRNWKWEAGGKQGVGLRLGGQGVELRLQGQGVGSHESTVGHKQGDSQVYNSVHLAAKQTAFCLHTAGTAYRESTGLQATTYLTVGVWTWSLAGKEELLAGWGNSSQVPLKNGS